MTRTGLSCTVVLELKGKELGRWTVTDQPLTIGRTTDNNIVVDNLSVSRRHAVLEPVDGACILRDAGSLNGIEVNGVVVDNAPLRDGDVITIGKHRLHVRLRDLRLNGENDPAAAESTIRRPKDEIEGTIDNPGHLFEVTELGEHAIPLNRSIIMIGSDAASDIQISGRSIAGYHAEIAYEDGTYTLRHLEGRRKVLVDDKAVKRCVLSDGCSIRIGDSTFRFKGPVAAESHTVTE